MKDTGKSDLGKILSQFSLEKFATSIRADYRFAPLNGFLLVAIFVIGLVIHLVLSGPFSPCGSLTEVTRMLSSHAESDI